MDLVPLMTAIQPSDAARPARDRAAQGVELPHGSRPGRAADFHRLAAGAWTRPVRQEARRCVSRLLGGAAFGGARHPDAITTNGACRTAESRAIAPPCLPPRSTARSTNCRHRYGDDMAGWTWGRAHIAPFPNQFWSNVPVMRSLLSLDIPTDGGSDTVNRGDMEYDNESMPFADMHGPGLRMIVDLACAGRRAFPHHARSIRQSLVGALRRFGAAVARFRLAEIRGDAGRHDPSAPGRGGESRELTELPHRGIAAGTELSTEARQNSGNRGNSVTLVAEKDAKLQGIY